MDDDLKGAPEKKVKITPNVSRRTIKIKIKGLDGIYKQAQEIYLQGVKEEVQEVADQEDTTTTNSNNNKDQTMISSIGAADGPSPSTYSGNLEGKAAAAADDDQEEIKEKVDDSDNNNSNSNNDNNKKSHVCILCHKCFSTNKKLHGHMRVHPERTYRGMVPPEGTVIKNANIQSGAANSLKKDELSWGNAFRRGRIGSSSQTRPPRPSDAEGWMSFHPIKELDNEHSEEDQAAVILQMISEHETDYSVTDKRAKSLLAGVLEYYQEEGGHKRLKITEDDDAHDDDDAHGGEAVEEQVVQLEKKEYTCQTCKRSFSTPQALGGHRASHSKVRNNTDEGESSERGKQQVSSGVQEIHQCKQCPAFYSCGQALGGHMRKHFLEEQAAETTSVKVLPTPRVSNFDLNLKPCEEEEEEEGGGGGGLEE